MEWKDIVGDAAMKIPHTISNQNARLCHEVFKPAQQLTRITRRCSKRGSKVQQSRGQLLRFETATLARRHHPLDQ